MNGGGDGGDKNGKGVLLNTNFFLFMEYYAETNCGNWYEHQQ